VSTQVCPWCGHCCDEAHPDSCGSRPRGDAPERLHRIVEILAGMAR
jgi:hypothetical protein